MSVASFANIVSHSEGRLFVLFMVSFAGQKPLDFLRRLLPNGKHGQSYPNSQISALKSSKDKTPGKKWN